MGYNVVFEGTAEMGGHAGIRTWSSFKSQEDFGTWFTADLQKRYTIVAEGCSMEECIRHTRKTPMACRLAAAVENSTMPDGMTNPDLLEHQLRKIGFL